MVLGPLVVPAGPPHAVLGRRYIRVALRRGRRRTWYYTTAWSLGHGLIPVTAIGYGYPLAARTLGAHRGGQRLAAASPLRDLPECRRASAPSPLLCIYGITKTIGGRRFAYARLEALGARAALAIPGTSSRLPPPPNQDTSSRRDRSHGARRLPLDGRGPRRGLLHVPRDHRRRRHRRPRGRPRGGVRDRRQARQRGVPPGAVLGLSAVARGPARRSGLSRSVSCLSLSRASRSGSSAASAISHCSPNHPQALVAGTDSAPVGGITSGAISLSLGPLGAQVRRLPGVHLEPADDRVGGDRGADRVWRRTIRGRGADRRSGSRPTSLSRGPSSRASTAAASSATSLPPFPAAFLLVAVAAVPVPIAGRRLAAYGDLVTLAQLATVEEAHGRRSAPSSAIAPLVPLLAFSEQAGASTAASTRSRCSYRRTRSRSMRVHGTSHV